MTRGLRPSRFPAGQRARTHGFVLAVTLWILAAIAVVAALVSLWAIEGVRDAGAMQEEAEDAVAAYGTAQTVIYLLATRDKTLAGLPSKAIDRAEYSARMLEDFGALRNDPVGGEMALDDQAYRGIGETRFSIQDAAGLIGFTWAVPPVADMLVASDPALQAQAARLRDTLLDYVDEDDDVRPNGAERSEYLAAGRPEGPPNRMLMSPWELTQVLGWENVPRASLEKLERIMTVHYLGPLNINTVPEEVLASMIQGCPALCRTWVEQRHRTPYTSHYELENRIAVDLPTTVDDYYRTMPDFHQRVTVWDRKGNGWRWNVRLTPMADKQAPWTILSVYPIHLEARDAESSSSPLFAAPQAGGR